MLLGALRKYFALTAAISVVGNIVLWYAWRGAEADVDKIRAEAALEATAAENRRWAEVASRLRQAHQERVTELNRRLAQSNQVTESSVARAQEAEGRLNDYIAAAEKDESPEYLQWASTELPPEVIGRLNELMQGE